MKKVRVSITYNNPNPLFIKWLQELVEDAQKNHRNKARFAFERALKSLRKYPLPIAKGQDCIILEDFGKKICDFLDKKLQEHEMRQTENEINCALFTELNSNLKKFPSSTNRDSSTVQHKCLSVDHGTNECEIESTELAITAKTMVDEDPVICISSSASSASMSDGETDIPALMPNTQLPDVELHLPHNKPQYSQRSNAPPKNNRKRAQISDDCLNTGGSTVVGVNIIETAPAAGVSQELNSTTKFLYSYSKLILLVDTAETIGKSKASIDQTLKLLTELKVEYEVRRLAVGDFLWVIREENGDEYVLPYIIERKRLDDLASSIKDGRFHDQKFRLKQSGIANVIYLIECYKNERLASLPIATLMQAAINTNVHGNFTVKYTDSHDHSMLYLSVMSGILTARCKNKTFMVMNDGTDLDHLSLDSSIVPVLDFNTFNKQSSKQRDCTVREIFVKQLLQLKYLTLEKALRITELYPSPRTLCLAFLNCPSVGEGEKLLANIKFGKLKKNIGINISRALYKLYTNTAPS